MRYLTTTPPPLPDAKNDAVRYKVELTAVTPILRGGPRTDEVDTARAIRAPALRGALRFFWRATTSIEDVEELREREGYLFGSVHPPSVPRASRVRVATWCQRSSSRTWDDLAVRRGRHLRLEPYTVDWVVPKEDRQRPLFHAAGARATLRVEVPESDHAQIEPALKALLLLGGVGSRWRRGLGALDVSHDALCPRVMDPDDVSDRLRALAPHTAERPWPSLSKVDILIGPSFGNAVEAWKAAAQALPSALRDMKGPRPRTTGGPNGRLPSPILIRPLRVGGRWRAAMFTLQAPAPGTSRGMSNKDPNHVHAFAREVAQLPGWSHTFVEGSPS